MRKTLNFLFAIITWFAVITQFYLMLENRTAPVPETIIRFFSFFTILTNTLVALYFTLQTFTKDPNSTFNKPGNLMAITVYITIVGLVYQLILRHIWQPTGLQMIVDELLHSVIPVFVIIYWILYEKKSYIKWRSIPIYLIYPILYITFTLIRGHFSDFYPYPFVNVLELGWAKVLTNVLLLFGLFTALLSVFIGVGKSISQIKN